MKILLSYGRNGLAVDLPEVTDVIVPRPAAGLRDESNALLESLRDPINSEPLREKIKPGDLESC